MLTIQHKTYDDFTIITWYKHVRVLQCRTLLSLGKIEENVGVNPSAIFIGLKLPVQKHESPCDGKSHGAFSQLPCIYQILINDLQFYILPSRPHRAVKDVLKTRELKNFNITGANNFM
jgi:hypothetical protein